MNVEFKIDMLTNTWKMSESRWCKILKFCMNTGMREVDQSLISFPTTPSFDLFPHFTIETGGL